jgi:hypothetical protein
MAGKNTAAFGIYGTNAAAERAVDQFIAAGFSNQDVSVLMADRKGSKDFAAEKNTKAGYRPALPSAIRRGQTFH